MRVNMSRIDSIITDLKSCIEDFCYEFKLLKEKQQTLELRLKNLEDQLKK